MLTTGQPTASSERRFFAAMTLAASAIVFAGFATSYYVWPIARGTHYSTGRPIPSTLPLIVHLHAALFTGWVCLFVAQAALVTSGNVKAHRRLGRIGAVLMALMVVVGLAAAVQGGRDGFNPRGPYRDAISFMFVGVTDIVVFTALTSTGVALRRRPDVHRRLMLLGTTGGLLWPAITRIPGIAGRPTLMFGLLASVVLAPAVRDVIVRARLRWLTLFVGLGVLATFPLRVAVANGAAWRSFAAWLVQ
jgi:hypothetical protein